MLDIPDAADLQQMLATNKDYMIPWIPWAVGEPETVEIKKKKIRTWKGEFYRDQKYTYGIFDKANSKLNGLIFLFTRQGKGILEIGYMIDRAATGKGYATQSSYALTKLGFKHIGIDKMVIHCSPRNKASVKVAEKLGYQLEGTYQLMDKGKDQKRTKQMIWAMFNEGFETNEQYEPVKFELEKGWE